MHTASEGISAEFHACGVIAEESVHELRVLGDGRECQISRTFLSIIMCCMSDHMRCVTGGCEPRCVREGPGSLCGLSSGRGELRCSRQLASVVSCSARSSRGKSPRLLGGWWDWGRARFLLVGQDDSGQAVGVCFEANDGCSQAGFVVCGFMALLVLLFLYAACLAKCRMVSAAVEKKQRCGSSCAFGGVGHCRACLRSRAVRPPMPIFRELGLLGLHV